VGNLGHVAPVKEAGLIMVGDIRLNAYNSSSVAAYEELGFESVILSPELSLAQQRDVGGRSAGVVYGRLPLMITEKCVGRELGGCDACDAGKTILRDRRDVEFPVMRRYEHRSVIFNSVPIYMADRADALKSAKITMCHYIFTVESKPVVDRIIASYESGKAIPDMVCKRIK
jgi:putative protease